MGRDKPKIFIIEDSPLYAKALQVFLEEKLLNEADIYLFEAGEESLRCLDLNPDIIILDYFLNEMDPDAVNGLELCRRIREKNASAQILLLSSQKETDVVMKATQIPVVYYVSKDLDAFEDVWQYIKQYRK